MSSMPQTSAVIVLRGYHRIGIIKHNRDGNVVSETEPGFVPDPKGQCIAVCDYNTETDEPVGVGDLFFVWESDSVQKRIWEKFGLTKRNFPTPEEFYKWSQDNWNGIEICDVCEGPYCGYDCELCPVELLKAKQEDDE